MNTPNPGEHIEGCHSCGAPPTVLTEDGFTHMECRNPECDLKVSVESRVRAVAIERWNRRADPKLNNQLRALRAYLWSVLALGNGTAEVPDALLQKAMGEDALLIVRAKKDGSVTQLRSVLGQAVPGEQPPEEGAPTILTLDKRIIRPGNGEG